MKKSLICLVVSAATLICLLVLPIWICGDKNLSLLNLITESPFKWLASPFKFLYSNMYTFALLLSLLAGIASVVSALFADRKAILISSIVGIGLLVASFLSSIDVTVLSYGRAAEAVESISHGIAFWIAGAGFLVNAVLAVILEKKWD